MRQFLAGLFALLLSYAVTFAAASELAAAPHTGASGELTRELKAFTGKGEASLETVNLSESLSASSGSSADRPLATLGHPSFVVGALIVLTWVGIFSCGMCALCGLQTPLRFEERGLSLNKEF